MIPIYPTLTTLPWVGNFSRQFQAEKKTGDGIEVMFSLVDIVETRVKYGEIMKPKWSTDVLFTRKWRKLDKQLIETSEMMSMFLFIFPSD